MTPALLDAIKARLAAADDLLDRMGDLGFDQDDADTLDDMRADLPFLVAEVERLRPLADNWATCLDVTREVHGTHGCIFCGYNGEGYWRATGEEILSGEVVVDDREGQLMVWAADTIATLTRERDEAQADCEQARLAWAMAADDRDRANGERDHLMKLLREIERDASRCPCCHSPLIYSDVDFDGICDGHAPDCRLAALIGGTK